jgi:hypothetical protein
VTVESREQIAEPGFRGDREVGVRVELQPEQCRPRARHPDDERRRELRYRSQTMTRMMIAIPTPTPVIESGVPACAQNPGFARERSW